jgi:SAM-dependent methyltransferase
MGVSRASTVAAWDRNWERYREERRIEETPQIQQWLLDLGCADGRRVLEVGAGTGGDSAALAAAGAFVVPLDFSAEAVQLIRETGRARAVTLRPVRGNAETMPFADAVFDLVFHQGFLEHFRDPERLLREQVRVLKTGGYLLIDVPQRFTVYAVKKFVRVHTGRWFAGYERSFSIFELRRLARRCGLTVVNAYGRGYSPHLVHHLRHLQGLRSHRMLGPPALRRLNDRLWGRFERSLAALLYFKDIGVVCRKDSYE